MKKIYWSLNKLKLMNLQMNKVINLMNLDLKKSKNKYSWSKVHYNFVLYFHN
jgi:hypothetical protein